MGEIADMLAADQRAIRRAGSAALQKVADDHLKQVQGRLDRGIGLNERRFTPYADTTARRKGRRQPVNLRESGRMRSALYVRRVRLDRYELTFRDRQSERIGRFQHGGTRRRTRADQRRRTPGRIRAGVVFRNSGRYHVPPRPWMGATTREINRADRILGVTISNAFPADLRRRILISFRV